ncbi:ABC transporter ATP-binding protein [Rheinheimera sp.]|uniref:ABC transporter ATP-binding protein n=1 Tax=Rheinheimera sp. TaxID=1869214 RepID=UPI00307DF2B9
MLHVTGISRRYGQLLAVNNVSFTIKKGEIIGLLGHNGAGKTTIMKMLSGYLDADSGTIELDGLNIVQHRAQIQRQLGYLPEHLPLYADMTVADYLDYAARLKGIAPAEHLPEIKRVVQATAIADKLSAPIGTLSRGYKQRVGVAQALLGKPRLLILDEPTNGLDPAQTLQMRALIQQIATEATVILSTHIMQEVQALCDRVLLIERGQLVLDQRIAELTSSKALVLGCSASLSTLQPLLSPLELSASELSPQLYRLTAADSVDWKALAAALSKALIRHDIELYQLQPEQRDLDSLFRRSQEVAHAA